MFNPVLTCRKKAAKGQWHHRVPDGRFARQWEERYFLRESRFARIPDILSTGIIRSMAVWVQANPVDSTILSQSDEPSANFRINAYARDCSTMFSVRWEELSAMAIWAQEIFGIFQNGVFGQGSRSMPKASQTAIRRNPQTTVKPFPAIVSAPVAVKDRWR